MPRADRLFALVQLLSAPGRRRLDELARELGTSPRSIYRDLADLEARGGAVKALADGQHGTGGLGGAFLHDDVTSAASNLAEPMGRQDGADLSA